MKRLALLLTVLAVPLHAEEMPIWPSGLPEGAKPLDAKKVEHLKKEQAKGGHIRVVETPTMTVMLADKSKANGCGVVVLPGGGYNIIAFEHEGRDIGTWFNALGVSAFILKYRVPRREKEQYWREPLQDAQRAIRLVRAHAETWGVDPKRIGLLGFSAGGHLTVTTALAGSEGSYPSRDSVDEQSCKPDFIMPIYAAYLGDPADDKRLRPEVAVNAATPPTFLAVTANDKMRGLHAALLFAELKKAGVPAEVHVYAGGGHGYGMRPERPAGASWPKRCADWMRVSGFLGSE